jgi:hypothetical protein
METAESIGTFEVYLRTRLGELAVGTVGDGLITMSTYIFLRIAAALSPCRVVGRG